MQPYDLPRTPVPPTWSSMGLWSLNTRPDLAVHRSQYNIAPRLFPASLEAQQLLTLTNQGHTSAHFFPHHQNRVYRGNQANTDKVQDYRFSSPRDLSNVKNYRAQKRFDNDGTLEENLRNHSRIYHRSSSHTVHPPTHSRRQAANDIYISFSGVQDSLLRQVSDEAFNVRETISRNVFDDPETVQLANPQGFGLGTTNPLEVVRVGGKRLVLCALSGYLDSAAAYDVTIELNDDGYAHHVQKKGRLLSPTNVMVNDTCPVTDIVSSYWDEGSTEPCRSIFATRRSLNFAQIRTDDDQPNLYWYDRLSFPDALSTAMNPLYPEEFAAVSAEGLFVGTINDFISRQGSVLLLHDVQTLARRSVFNRVVYGHHPRSLLMSNRNKVVNFDIRMPARKLPQCEVFDVRRHWHLSKNDCGISAFHLMESRCFNAIVATKYQLNYLDLRMPTSPLLDWSLTMPKAFDLSCVGNVHSNGCASEFIGFWSRQQACLQVYHATHQDRDPVKRFELSWERKKEEIDLFARKARWEAPPIAKRSILWSDLPLGHLQQLKGESKISGMGFLAGDDGNCVSLLQWSRTDGLIGQVLEIRPGNDAYEEFESTEYDGLRKECSLQMQKFQERLVDCGMYKGVEWMENPSEYSTPGSQLMRRIRRNYQEPLKLILNHVDSGMEDDVDEEARLRIARPFLQGLEKVDDMREMVQGPDDNTDIDEVGNEKIEILKEVKRDKEEMESVGENRRRIRGNSPNATTRPSSRESTDSDEMTAGVRKRQKGEKKVENSIRVPYLGSDDESSSSWDSKEDDGMGSLKDEIGFGIGFEKIAEITRRGMKHCKTPLGVGRLKGMLDECKEIEWTDVKWHEGCGENHEKDDDVVTTSKRLPDWVHTRVYHTRAMPNVEDCMKMLEIGESSNMGKLVTDMVEVVQKGLELTEKKEELKVQFT